MSITPRLLWQLLLAILAVRLISLGLYPLMDTTEARYGEMARLMVETGNWLTPQFDYGVWFWGKPPMQTWVSAIGIKLFGNNEFAVRFPHWLAAVATIAVTLYFAKKVAINGLLAVVMLASSAIFLIAAGAVMTDMLLTLGMTIAMVGFYLAWRGDYKMGYVAFIGLAIGLLSKGPLIIVLMGIAVFPWLVIQHGFMGAFKTLWQRFPLISGLALMFAIAAPWYLMAEKATPGFLEYFLVGEHFMRFVVSGWEGDLYGSAHSEPKGTIWLFWLYSALPWSVALPILWFKRDKTKQTNGLQSFLLWWALSPMLLFTVAGNILPAYVLPGIPALALLCASLVSVPKARWLLPSALLTTVLIIIALFVLNNGRADRKSDRLFYQHIEAQAFSQTMPLLYWQSRPFSAQYYSEGRAVKVTDIKVITEQTKPYLLFLEQWKLKDNLALIPHQCERQIENRNRVLFLCTPN